MHVQNSLLWIDSVVYVNMIFGHYLHTKNRLTFFFCSRQRFYRVNCELYKLLFVVFGSSLPQVQAFEKAIIENTSWILFQAWKLFFSFRFLNIIFPHACYWFIQPFQWICMCLIMLCDMENLIKCDLMENMRPSIFCLGWLAALLTNLVLLQLLAMI